jgi:superfamily II RNA helicase
MSDCEERGAGVNSETEDEGVNDLAITQAKADYNYMMAGGDVEEPEDQISISKYQHLLLNDDVHQKIMQVLQETKILFKLSDFQMISLHILGSKRNLVLVSPTGSGKMLGENIIVN